SGQGVRPARRPVAGRPVEEALQPATALRQVAADLPEPPQPGGEAQAGVGLAVRPLAPAERRPQVVVLAIESIEPAARLGSTEEGRSGLLDEREVPVAVSPPRRIGLAGR